VRRENRAEYNDFRLGNDLAQARALVQRCNAKTLTPDLL